MQSQTLLWPYLWWNFHFSKLVQCCVLKWKLRLWFCFCWPCISYTQSQFLKSSFQDQLVLSWKLQRMALVLHQITAKCRLTWLQCFWATCIANSAGLHEVGRNIKKKNELISDKSSLFDKCIRLLVNLYKVRLHSAAFFQLKRWIDSWWQQFLWLRVGWYQQGCLWEVSKFSKCFLFYPEMTFSCRTHEEKIRFSIRGDTVKKMCP